MNEYVQRIKHANERAFAHRISINQNSNTGGASDGCTAEECKAAKKLLRSYDRQLLSLGRAHTLKGKQQVSTARTRITSSVGSRFAAVVRATEKIRKPIPFTKLEQTAKDLSLHAAYHETVEIHPLRSKPGSYRPIAHSGHRRKAQQLILRDILLVLMGDSDCDSTVAGAGGEKATFEGISKAIDGGYQYWVSIDVRNFFPSLRPGHLAGFPLPKWMIENLVFLPPETPISFVDQKNGIELSEQSILTGDEDDLPMCSPYSMGELQAMLKSVRQGLLQGDVCAPQIARTFLGRELQRTLEKWDVAFTSHLDDIAICACSHQELKASLDALTSRLKSHPAGPLELHDHSITHISEGFEYLGYQARLLDSGVVHVRPTAKRFLRFRERLWERLENCEGFTKVDLRAIAKKYQKRWYDSQAPWTKVTGISGDDFSEVYVNTEREKIINRFILRELMTDIGSWAEDDLDHDLLDEEDLLPDKL